MDINILLLDDNLDGAIQALQESLQFGSDNNVVNILSSSSGNTTFDLSKIVLHFTDNDLGDVTVNLFHNHYEINTKELILEVVSEIKESNQFDLVLIDDNWGDGEGFLWGQNKILPGLFSDTDCHYALFTAHTVDADRIRAFAHLAHRHKHLASDRISLLGKDDRHSIYYLISRMCGEKNKKKEIEESLLNSSDHYGIIGNSKEMINVFKVIGSIATKNVSSVLIHGETGTGKELVAKAIHNQSRPGKPYQAINCGNIQENLIESELFGHLKGAFTDANRDKKGQFALADNGTIFLDEIGEMPPAMQVKLLRVLQEREFVPLGSESTIHVDVMVLCATHRDLLSMVHEGSFRADLFYRLMVIPIEIPPLRERKGDLRLLVEHFLQKQNAKQGTSKQIHQNVIDFFESYYWPGNVRELENCIENIVLLTSGNIITTNDLPKYIYTPNVSSANHHNIGTNSPDGAVSVLFPDEELRSRARKFLERWENACSKYPEAESITMKMIGQATSPSTTDKAIIGNCKRYGDVMIAFLDEFPDTFFTLNNKTNIRKSCERNSNIDS
ncbi:MAG: sigma 54-interacting transcriptional regulator [Desulfobulbaceae bacterium]|nr:sigma 54-interacting transcriptional regulator [Desulfobulbaceae bacterium]